MRVPVIPTSVVICMCNYSRRPTYLWTARLEARPGILYTSLLPQIIKKRVQRPTTPALHHQLHTKKKKEKKSNLVVGQSIEASPMHCMIATRNRPWTCPFFWHSIQFDPLAAQGCVMENACPAWVELALLWTLSYKSIHSDAIAWFSLCLWGQVLESLYEPDLYLRLPHPQQPLHVVSC